MPLRKVMMQVEVVDAEAYMYDGECIAKAEEMRKPGLVDIIPMEVHPPPPPPFMCTHACTPLSAAGAQRMSGSRPRRLCRAEVSRFPLCAGNIRKGPQQRTRQRLIHAGRLGPLGDSKLVDLLPETTAQRWILHAVRICGYV